jgi:hypothetical protein
VPVSCLSTFLPLIEFSPNFCERPLIKYLVKYDFRVIGHLKVVFHFKKIEEIYIHPIHKTEKNKIIKDINGYMFYRLTVFEKIKILF